jgi:uroporphyrinogen-III decarboxylase
MTNRELITALLAGNTTENILQWIQGFESIDLMKRLISHELHYEGFSQYFEDKNLRFSSIGEKNLIKQLEFNEFIDKPVFPVGWGANADFGHGGPGEFNAVIVEKNREFMVVQYETGCKKKINFSPYFTKAFDLPIKNQKDLLNIDLPDIDNSHRFSGFSEDVEWAKAKGEWTIGWVNGFFSGVHYYLRDYEEFLLDLAADPKFAKAMIDKIGDWTLNSALKMCEAGVDCIGFCDDLGSSDSLLISPAMYREFIWPWHKKLCDLVHDFEAVVHIHSHGAIMPILQDLKNAGIDILNPIDPDDYMDMTEIREVIGHNIVLCGGLNKHFFDWSKDEQVKHLEKVLEDGRKKGPYILMDSGGIPSNVNKEWFEWFLNVSKELRFNE